MKKVLALFYAQWDGQVNDLKRENQEKGVKKWVPAQIAQMCRWKHK